MVRGGARARTPAAAAAVGEEGGRKAVHEGDTVRVRGLGRRDKGRGERGTLLSI
jgi:hypothetical protein